MIVWRDGEFIPALAANSDALSSGHLVGWGAFTTFRIAGKQAIWLPRHLERLRRNGAQLELESSFHDAEWRLAVEQLIADNRIEDGFGRATLTGGRDARWGGNGVQSQSQSLLSVANLPASNSRDGLRVWLSPAHQDARRPLCGVKCTSYAMWQWLWQQGQKRGCDEALIRDNSGALCEGARSNVFWLRNGEIFTPALSTGCLPGIARGWILQTAQSNGWTLHETHATPDELLCAQEIWMCNAVSGPRAVQEIVIDTPASTCTDAAKPKQQPFWKCEVAQNESFVARLQELWAQDIARNSHW